MKRSISIFTIIMLVPVMFISCADSGKDAITAEDVMRGGKIAGLELTDSEIDTLLANVSNQLSNYLAMREIEIPNSVPPALVFDPVIEAEKVIDDEGRGMSDGPDLDAELPENMDDLAFYSARELAGLLRMGSITSVELTRYFLERLETLGPKLECVITLTEELAMEQAKKADREISEGHFRSLLHGIPYGAKDLLAVKGYRTTWGAEPYRDQKIDRNATVIEKLEEAGAVLVAKLSLGALAWGDVWFDGMTRNPWDITEGSSGSSAGSASATAAGLVPFAIGTETWGSIVSPSTRCGATGLRPTFGRVSREGAMALSWSMDKIGPICRSVGDCVIVFDIIRGPDGKDRTVRDHPFRLDPEMDMNGFRIGYIESAFDEDYEWKETDLATLDRLRSMGAVLVPIELPDYPVYEISFILEVEAAAAFDELTRSGQDDRMVRQVRNAWPNVFRYARLIPAVEYIQANRIRYMLMRDMDELEVDVWVSPSFQGANLLVTNLTGHPCVVLPNGFSEEGKPVSITFNSRLFGEGILLTVAGKYQQATDFHKQHPPLFQGHK